MSNNFNEMQFSKRGEGMSMSSLEPVGHSVVIGTTAAGMSMPELTTRHYPAIAISKAAAAKYEALRLNDEQVAAIRGSRDGQ